MKVIALVQARMGSTRLPNKVMKPIRGIPMIERLLSRLSHAKEVNQIVVATSVDGRNQPLVEHVRKLGYACEQGSENDVLDRFVQVARTHQADVVVRITGDCPLVDPGLVDEVIRRFKATGVDYFSNIDPPTYPDGLDIEVCTFKVLEQASQETSNPLTGSMSPPTFANSDGLIPPPCNTTKTSRRCAGRWMNPMTSLSLRRSSSTFTLAPILLGSKFSICIAIVQTFLLSTDTSTETKEPP